MQQTRLSVAFFVALALTACDDGGDAAALDFRADFGGLTTIVLTIENTGDEEILLRACDEETPLVLVEERDADTGAWERVAPLDDSCVRNPFSQMLLAPGDVHELEVSFQRNGTFRFAVDVMNDLDPITGEGRLVYSGNTLTRRG